MGIFIPYNELTVQEIAQIKEAAKQRAIQILQTTEGLGANDLIFRQPIVGGSSATDFKDLLLGTTSASNAEQEWLIDSAALTAGDLINVISTTAGEKSSDLAAQTSCVFYGVTDVAGGQDLIAIQFKKGARTQRFWYVQPMYAYPVHVGYSRDMAEFGPKDTVQIKMELRVGATAATGEDYAWIVNGILAEAKAKSLAEG